MKKLLWGVVCLLVLACVTAAMAQDQVIITYRDGRVQAIDQDSILRIEFRSGGHSTAAPYPESSGAFSMQSYNYQTHYIRHRNFLGEITPISSDLDRKDSAFRMVPGLADSRYISFESVNYPGYFLRHANYRLRLDRNDNSPLFRADATFKRVPGLADRSWTSFESFNYPNHYIRHSGFHLYISTGNDGLFRSDTTFRVGPAH